MFVKLYFMMDDLKQLALFAEVVRAGSLSAAARHLGISTSAVSQQLRALEQSHGVTLLHRSTRKLALTGAGAQLATHATAIVDAAARARAQLSLTRDAPEGELRVSAPAGFARHLAPALAPLLVQYPSLTLRLQVDDRMIDPASTWRYGAVACPTPIWLHAPCATSRSCSSPHLRTWPQPARRPALPICRPTSGWPCRVKGSRSTCSFNLNPAVTL